MTVYVAPVKDMMFVLEEVAGLDEVAALPGCEDVGADLVSAVLDEAGRLAEEVIAPLNKTSDQQGATFADHAVKTSPGFKDAYKQFAEGGWIGLTCDPEYGGQGLPYLLSIPVSEIWNSACTSFALCPMLTSGAIEAITHHASDELKAIYLPKMISGEWTGTMNLTEPNAGSDLAAVRTKAVPNGDHYLISGTKIFITYGEHDYTDNIIHLVLARLPDAPPGVKGISLFVVPKFLVNADGSLGARNDAKCVSIEHKMGIHGSPTAVMAFGEGAGAVGYLVGEANRGLEYMFTMMNHARLAVGLEGVGIAERSYQQALGYATERIQGRVVGREGALPIAYHPDVRRMLMSMRSQTEAMRALSLVAAAAMDKAERCADAEERKRQQARIDLLIPVVKAWCTEQANEIAYTGVQVHGGMGFIEETGAAQHQRDARITTIYEGTTGIQANDLMGRKVARDGGEAAFALIAEMGQTVAAAQADAALKTLGDTLAEAVGHLKEATAWIVANYGSNTPAALMGANHYLKLMGTVAGGWVLVRSALAAQTKLAAGQGDAGFYKQKIATTGFYADQVLPLTASLLTILRRGESSLKAADAALG
ncbi:MAG: acyl-CoA dehydrogenase [Rhodocyclaceae bacterium]|nr:MAG: acyl-CoA dehydrogenase [Rhodocyclaceae bacterium]